MNITRTRHCSRATATCSCSSPTRTAGSRSPGVISPAASSFGTPRFGDKTLGVGFFLFDYVCSNRIVWGADQYTEVRIRHTSGAPDRWLEETIPVLTEYSEGSAK